MNQFKFKLVYSNIWQTAKVNNLFLIHFLAYTMECLKHALMTEAFQRFKYFYHQSSGSIQRYFKYHWNLINGQFSVLSTIQILLNPVKNFASSETKLFVHLGQKKKNLDRHKFLWLVYDIVYYNICWFAYCKFNSILSFCGQFKINRIPNAQQSHNQLNAPLADKQHLCFFPCILLNESATGNDVIMTEIL